MFADTVLIPGITYNAEYDGDVQAGLVNIYKEIREDRSEPGQPAQLFNHEDTANELIPLALNNAYRKSKRIFQVTENSCSYPKAETNLALAVSENRDDRQASALACLVNEGTVVTSTATTTSDKVVEMRKGLRKSHARADIVFASVEEYANMLKEAGDKYTPTTNDAIITNGQVGRYLGMTWFEVDALDGSASYYDYSGTKQTIDLSEVALIVYDSRTLHLADNLSMMRLKDSENFTGVLAQNEINTGFRVTNPVRVAVLMA